MVDEEENHKILENGLDKSYPSIRRPISKLEEYSETYGVFFNSFSKTIMDYNAYYLAGTSEYVNRCIFAISQGLLLKGFNIVSDDDESTIISSTKRNYLTNMFKHPHGRKDNYTFAHLHHQFMRSFLLTGDAFIEANEDAHANMLSGFKFIPPEMLYWDAQIEAWAYRSHPDIYYEPDELVHIYRPNIEMQDRHHGVCVIDSILPALKLHALGLKYNTTVLENGGLDPNSVLSFAPEVRKESMDDALKRMEYLTQSGALKRGMLAVQGATFQTAGNSNRDLEFGNLMDRCRHIIISGYGVPPQKAGIIETANLGSGSGDSQDRDFDDTLAGNAILVEDAFNCVLGNNGFDELLEYNEIKTQDPKVRSEIELNFINAGIMSINEVRAGYDLPPVPGGDMPKVNSQGG